MPESPDLERVLRELRARDDKIDDKIDGIARELAAAKAVADRNEEILDDIRLHINNASLPKTLLSWVQPVAFICTALGLFGWAYWVQPLELRVEALAQLGERNRASIEAFMSGGSADDGP